MIGIIQHRLRILIWLLLLCIIGNALLLYRSVSVQYKTSNIHILTRLPNYLEDEYVIDDDKNKSLVTRNDTSGSFGKVTGSTSSTPLTSMNTAIENGERVAHQDTPAYDVKKLLIAGYMRGGTTFVGDLFQNNPDAIYWYEPLGGFYSYYYGVKAGASHGVGLRKMGAVRILDGDEKELLADFIGTLLDCNTGKLPVGAILHPFWDHCQETYSFRRCMFRRTAKPISFVRNQTNNLQWTSYEHCANTFTVDYCSKEWIESSIRSDCPRLVRDARKQLHQFSMSNDSSIEMKPFLLREACFMKWEGSRLECSRIFGRKCQSRSLRVMKVHRFSMQAAEALLTRVPNIKIIYYVRDPRAIEMSRNEFGFPIKHVRGICHQMALDNALYDELSQKYPGSFLRVRYEDLAQNYNDTAGDIYHFLGLNVPQLVKTHFTQNFNIKYSNDKFGTKRADSNKTANAWRSKVKIDDLSDMNSFCKDILIQLGYHLN